MGVTVLRTPVRRRAPGFGAVVPKLPAPSSPQEIGQYQGRAVELQNAQYRASDDRKVLAIGAGVTLSVGLTMLLALDGSGGQKAGAVIAGIGVATGIAAILSHLRMTDFEATKVGYVNALASVGAPAPGISIPLDKG